MQRTMFPSVIARGRLVFSVLMLRAMSTAQSRHSLPQT